MSNTVYCDIYRAIMDVELEIPDLFGIGGKKSGSRFNVYRNNVIVSLIEVMRNNFPIVYRFLGSDYFSYIVKIFIVDQPPKKPVNFEYGDGFPAFLSTVEELQKFPFLSDLAQIEILWRSCYNAADAPILALEKLVQIINSCDPSQICLKAHPSFILFSSKYPVYSIWHANRFIKNDVDVGKVNITDRPEYIAIARPDEVNVYVIELTLKEYHIACKLKKGVTLEEAAFIDGVNVAQELSAVMARLVSIGSFTENNKQIS